MAVNLWMLPWIPRDFAASTRGWSFEARGIYRELLDAQWDLGELPARTEQLRRIVGCSEAVWDAAWPEVESKFPCVRGKRKNARLEEHRIRAVKLTKSRSEGAKATNTKLYGNAERNARRDAKRTHQDQVLVLDQVLEQKQSQVGALSDVSTLVSRKRSKAAGSVKSTPEIDMIFEHWKQTHGHRSSKLDAKRIRLIAERLKNYSVADICQSISGFTNSPHHMGLNDRSTKYDSIELLLKDSKHVDMGLQFHAEPPRTDQSAETKRIIEQTKDWIPPEARRNGH